MTVGVNSINNNVNARNQDLLVSALGLATNLYKVNLDDKQTMAAQALTAKKDEEKLSAEDEDRKLAFAKDFEIVKPDARGAIDPNAVGLKLPVGLNLPQGMAIRPRSVSENEIKLAAASADKAAARENKAPPQTMGQKALDSSFARDFNDWETSGKSTVAKNLTGLQDVVATLEKRKDDLIGTSGRFTGNLPDFMRSEESVALRERVHQAAQSSLKATLGNAFTEKEGERIMNASYNEKLSPAENIKRINATIAEITDRANNMENRARYFEENGTLTGLRGSGFSPNQEVADNKDKDKKVTVKGVTITPAQAAAELEKRNKAKSTVSK
jgi:hypothetical protein